MLESARCSNSNIHLICSQNYEMGFNFWGQQKIEIKNPYIVVFTKPAHEKTITT